MSPAAPPVRPREYITVSPTGRCGSGTLGGSAADSHGPVPAGPPHAAADICDMSERVLYDSHMHTPLCKHARGEPSDYARVAHARGLRGIVFTCHNPMPEFYRHQGRMAPEQVPEYVALVAAARQAWAGELEVHLGLECDFLPGIEPWLERQLNDPAADYQYVLGSVHPHLPGYRDTYWADDPVQYQRTYFGHLAEAAETGLFDALAHPDLVKNVTAEHWDPLRVMDAIEPALDRIAGAGVAMELNTSGASKPVPEMNPAPPIVARMAEREIPVVLGSDAHDPHRVAEHFDAALELLEAHGYATVSVILGGRRREVPIAAARATLTAPDEATPTGPDRA